MIDRLQEVILIGSGVGPGEDSWGGMEAMETYFYYLFIYIPGGTIEAMGTHIHYLFIFLEKEWNHIFIDSIPGEDFFLLID